MTLPLGIRLVSDKWRSAPSCPDCLKTLGQIDFEASNFSRKEFELVIQCIHCERRFSLTEAFSLWCVQNTGDED